MTIKTWKLTDTRYDKFAFKPEVNRQLAMLRPDNHTGALYIAKDYLVIFLAASTVLHLSWWFYPLAVILIGAHQRGLTTISHDAAHQTLARNKTWNYMLGILFAAYPLFQKHYAYRISHVYRHHPNLGDMNRDPDLKFFLNSGVYEVCHPIDYLFRIVIWPMIGGASVNYLGYLWNNRFKVSELSDNHVDPRHIQQDNIGFAVFWIIVTIGSLVLGLFDELLLFWIVPYLTAFQVLGWFVEIAEHSPMCETESSNIYLTRNRKGNWVERTLFGVNLDEYHLEHHLSPGVPFWLLAKAQKIRMQDPEYVKVAETWGGLFVAGPQGQKSVIRHLYERNEKLYWATRLSEIDRAAAHLPVGSS